MYVMGIYQIKSVNGIKEFVMIPGSLVVISAVTGTKRRSFLHDCKNVAVVLWYGFVVIVLIWSSVCRLNGFHVMICSS